MSKQQWVEVVSIPIEQQSEEQRQQWVDVTKYQCDLEPIQAEESQVSK